MASDSRIGVYICQVGIGVADAVNLQAVADYAAELPNVVQTRVLGVRPRLDPKALTAEIKRIKLDRVVIAGDSPGYFKPAFTRAMAEAGGDPLNVCVASFREHGAGIANSTTRIRSMANAAPSYKSNRSRTIFRSACQKGNTR